MRAAASSKTVSEANGRSCASRVANLGAGSKSCAMASANSDTESWFSSCREGKVLVSAALKPVLLGRIVRLALVLEVDGQPVGPAAAIRHPAPRPALEEDCTIGPQLHEIQGQGGTL